MKLLLIRHAKMAGDPYATPPSPVTGCLAKEGITQAETLAAALADKPIDVALASPYGRAVETAERALAGRNIPLVRVPGLEEWMPSDADVAARYRERLGEGAYDLLARVVPAFLDALAREGWHNRNGGWVPDTGTESKTIAVFAHGGSLNAMLSFLLGVRPFPVGAFSFQYCGVAAVDFTERHGVYYPCLRIA